MKEKIAEIMCELCTEYRKPCKQCERINQILALFDGYSSPSEVNELLSADMADCIYRAKKLGWKSSEEVELIEKNLKHYEKAFMAACDDKLYYRENWLDPESKVYRMVKCGECEGSGTEDCPGEYEDGDNIDCENKCPLDKEPLENGPCTIPCSHCENGEVKEIKTIKEIMDEGGWNDG